MSEVCSRLKRQYGEKTLSYVSVYWWSSVFKKGREMENEPHEPWPRTSITGENSDRVHALIRENRKITVCELSGILNISDGNVKTIIKQHLQYLKVAPHGSCVYWQINTRVHGCKSSSHCCHSTSRKGTFFGFYCDDGQDVGALLHAQEQTFFNAVSPRVSETQKSENHVLCWERYGHYLLGL